MPKTPRLVASEAEALLLRAGFVWVRSKGSHRIYMSGTRRVVVPFHAGVTLHPKTVKEVLDAIEEAGTEVQDPG
jgi:predicted RNA binding protein YcfA (HicA-like mRNA interferase family)